MDKNSLAIFLFTNDSGSNSLFNWNLTSVSYLQPISTIGLTFLSSLA